MAPRLRVPAVAGPLVAAILLALPAAASADALVRYSFDDARVETGPDTFRVFEHARGSVGLDFTYRTSGHSAVRVQDVAGDGDFPELQGYFPLRSSGTLQIHFALLVADPQESLNIGLAGPRGFRLGRDALAIWLETRDGVLLHVSDSIPKRLLPLDPFRWYFVDIRYDIERGRYDLAIRREGLSEPLVELADQPNAASQPGSSVDKFSFIGDRGRDSSNVSYWVDDVAIDVDEFFEGEPFVAPGRRKLFFERWYEAAARLRGSPRCLPAVEPRDLGLDARALRELEREGRLDGLLRLAAGDLGSEPPRPGGPLGATASWARGCAALERGRPAVALAFFKAALEAAPSARLFELSALLAEAALGRWRDVDARLRVLFGAWGDDPRLAAALGMVGIARGDLEEAERWLRGTQLDPADAPDALGRLTADRYYFVLLWQGRFDDAALLARDRVRLAGAAEGARWREREGDAAVFGGDYARARDIYRGVAERPGAPASALLKLSDVHFALGDLEAERRYRERVYGTLFSASR
jgi:tetratricopeptide (TPR) repeat protein